MADKETVAERGGRRAPELRLTGSRYELGERIGAGGMGEVIDARDRQLGRDVAIKRMLDDDPSDRAVQRFLREARVQARLDHPAVVPVHELGRDADGHPFFAMKKLAGTTLRTILEQDGASQQRLLRAMVDVCLAIELAHTRGVIHRDLKPDNIMLGDFGEVYVLDWGVAKVVDGDDDDFGDVISGSGEHATRAGTEIGTRGYMAPEQMRGIEDLDARADVYSLGCILFEILTGNPPGVVACRPAEAAPDRKIAVELDELCGRALAEDRDARIGSARELATGIQSYLDGDRDLARRRELASEHLERARDAFTAGDDHRALAMREAGYALALDPTRAEAADLMCRLMLEPPRSLPAEVRAAMDSQHQGRLKSTRIAVLAGFCTLIVCSIAITWISHTSWQPAAIIAALAVMNIVVLFAAPRFMARTHWLLIAPVISAAVIIAVFGRIYSPLLIAPGLAASMQAAMIFNLPYRSGWFVIFLAGVMLLTVMGPLIGEQIQLLSRTMEISRDRIVLVMPSLPSAFWQLALALFHTAALVIVTAVIAYRIRRSDAQAKQALFLQTWHLQQLVTVRPRSR